MKSGKNWKRGEQSVARVVFTEPAEYDLLDIEYYIFVDLDELLSRLGIRITFFDNYNIFYILKKKKMPYI